MSNGLGRLGIFSFRHKWLVLVFWILLLGLTTFLMTRYAKAGSSDITIPGTEAQVTLTRVENLFPSIAGASGRVVFEAPTGQTIAADKPQIESAITRLCDLSFVKSVIDPFSYTKAIATNGQVAYAQVTLNIDANAVTTKTTNQLQSVLTASQANGLKIAMGGDIAMSNVGQILGSGEIIGVGVALIVLVLTLGSLIAAGMPLIIAILAVGIGATSIYALSRVITVTSTTPVLAIMLGLAVGIDYSLFIISRYRSYVISGMDYETATKRALSTAGNAVVFAALTVIIALSALSVVRIPFMTTMGLAGAGTIAVAALIAITVVPALLGIARGHIFSRRVRRHLIEHSPKIQDSHGPATFWHRWGATITRRPVLVLIVFTIILLVSAWPLRNLQLGLPNDQTSAPSTTQHQAYEMLASAFGAGFNAPLIVLVDHMPPVTAANIAAAKQTLTSQYLASLPHTTTSSSKNQAATLAIEQAAAMAKINASAVQVATYGQLTKVTTKLSHVNGVKTALLAGATSNGATGIVEVIPTGGPSDSSTTALIKRLRTNQANITGHNGVTLAVTGTTAVQTDVNHKLLDALPEYLGVVVGLSLLILIIAFRSLLVPVKATIGFLLSVGSVFGALVAVFQYGWFGIASPAPIVSFLPIIMIGILFGLAMDYEFFIVSSMHEAYIHSGNAKQAVVDGFGIGSKVVTAAAIIMVSVFAGFAGSDDVIIRQIGFSLAFGVFIDAFIVRMTLVPAIMSLLGRTAWWLPKFLDRLIPHLSLEGDEN